MDYIKRDQIKKMLKFLDYGIHDELVMQSQHIPQRGYVSCDRFGKFFTNKSLSRRPLLVPPSHIIFYTHATLVSKSKLKLMSLFMRFKMIHLEHLIIKVYELEFLL